MLLYLQTREKLPDTAATVLRASHANIIVMHRYDIRYSQECQCGLVLSMKGEQANEVLCQ